jgi:hypothetical protein
MKKSELKAIIKEELLKEGIKGVNESFSKNNLIKNELMKRNELKKIIKEILLKESNGISDELYNDIFNEKYKEAEVSLRYATKAQSLFDDSFKKYGKQRHSNTYLFKKPEYLADFIDSMIQNENMPEGEIEIS